MFLDTGFLQDGEIRLVLTKTAEGDPVKNWVPAYHFDICDMQGNAMGKCDLRIGHNELLYYGGNIGYRIEAPYRGHHYAAKACRLLFELAKKHELGYVIITCSTENIPSRKTCEAAGGRLLEVTEVPQGNDMRDRGVTHVRIYRFDL